MSFGQKEKDKKKKGSGGKSDGFGSGVNADAFISLAAQVAAQGVAAATFATQAQVQAAQATADAAATAAAANAAAATAEEAADQVEEATTDTEQATQDTAIGANATAAADNSADITALQSGLSQLDTAVSAQQTAQDSRLDAIEAQLPDDDSALTARLDALEAAATGGGFYPEGTSVATDWDDEKDSGWFYANGTVANGPAGFNDFKRVRVSRLEVTGTLIVVQEAFDGGTGAVASRRFHGPANEWSDWVVNSPYDDAAVLAAITALESDRVLRTGDTMTGPLEVPAGTVTDPALISGDWGLSTTINHFIWSLNGEHVASIVQADSDNKITARGTPGRFGSIQVFQDPDIGNFSWAMRTNPAAAEHQTWIAPVMNGEVGQTLVSLSSSGSSTTFGWEWGAEKLAAEQGQNLIFNGYAWTGDTSGLISSNATNILTLDTDDCSFVLTGSTSSSMFFDKIKIKAGTSLQYRGMVKGDGRTYFGIRFRDANEAVIDYHRHTYYPLSVTQLAQPFAPGDTTMVVDDVTGWNETGGVNVRGGLAFIPEDGNEEGKIEPQDELGLSSFSYNNFNAVGAGGGYTKDNATNTITFAEPVTRNDYFKNGQAWPVGTWVRQPITRGPYRYSLVNYVCTPEWHTSDVTMVPNTAGTAALGIPPGAEYADPMVLVLRNGATEQKYKNFSLYEV